MATKVNMIDDLKEKESSLESRISTIKYDNRQEAIAWFEIKNGCKTCDGRGWVVTWDTLDCMRGSYATYGSCPNEECTDESRKASGLLPRQSKYDSWNHGSTWQAVYSSKEKEELSDIELQLQKVRNDLFKEKSLWNIQTGKLVKVARCGRERRKDRRTPVGITGLVKRIWTDDWGTEKTIIIDDKGQKWWPKKKTLEVIDPEPDTKIWDDLESDERKRTGMPTIVTIKAASAKAALVMTTNSKEFWVPSSQCSELKGVRKGQTLSIILPGWLAKQKGLLK
jgi:hypothetical protein